MVAAAVIIFVATYAGVALGHAPRLALDRTGIALLGAIAMVAAGVLTTAGAVAAIDFPTILLLYGLMVVSSQFRLAGFYTLVALRLAALIARPRLFLAALIAVTALLSALLTNDIVCLAFTPVLTVALLRARRDPVPYLLALACASNIGSAATIIGNPQNMLIGQVGRLAFGPFLLWCLPPVILALLLLYVLVARLCRARLTAVLPAAPAPAAGDWPAYDAHQAHKGLIGLVVLIGLFFSPLPRELSALAVAGIFLCSRFIRTRAILGFVDWHLITLFCGLFVVVGGFLHTGYPDAAVLWLRQHGLPLADGTLLTLVAVLLSNIVSNVPAVMMLVKFLDPLLPQSWYVLALASTFAGNLFTIGSIANLIVIEQARLLGVPITFRAHLRIGLPVTLASLAVLLLWLRLA